MDEIWQWRETHAAKQIRKNGVTGPAFSFHKETQPNNLTRAKIKSSVKFLYPSFITQFNTIMKNSKWKMK